MTPELYLKIQKAMFEAGELIASRATIEVIAETVIAAELGMIYVVGGWAYQENQLVTDDFERAKKLMESHGGPGNSGFCHMTEWDPKTGERTGRRFELNKSGKVVTDQFSEK